jgi:AhpD family alkylhydroperoxidase
MKDTTKFTDAEAVREKVRTGYSQIAQDGGSCCSSASSCCGSAPPNAEKLAQHVGYSMEELAALPEGANMGLSCGNPNALAALVSDTERMVKAAGLVDVVLMSKSGYVDGMVDWQDPLYQKIIAHLPVGTKPSDYITSLEVTARKPQAEAAAPVPVGVSKPASKLEVFDPAMCCSTGVCGPSVDPKLAQFAADLDWLKSQGVPVERYNLAQTPAAFAANAKVKSTLDKHGTDCLPLLLVDGSIASVGSYPTRMDMAQWAGLAPSKAVYNEAVGELVALGAAIAANCQPCFKYHHQKAQALGLSEDDMTSAVNTAMAVKKMAEQETLELADQMLSSVPEAKAQEGGCGCSSKSGCC